MNERRVSEKMRKKVENGRDGECEEWNESSPTKATSSIKDLLSTGIYMS